MSRYPRGSEWRIWDLHVHSPDSIEHNYGGPNPWDRYLTELAALPPDIKVVGINDYWFLDGYKTVRAAFERGDLPNLEEVFPVLEVRCDTFGGTEAELSRLNLHMICDPLLSVATLETQLHPLMQATYQLTTDDAPSTWSQFPTRDSLIDLGNQIIESSPPDKRNTFPSPLRTGFNNLNVSFETLRVGIENNSLLNGRVALAIGKAEWAEIKWSQQAAAQKKHLINSVAAVFTASPSRDKFYKSRQSLRDANVRDRLLHCSDAHSWMDSQVPNRLGECMTWVNADPTFKGLLQALQEYGARVCIEERPPVLTRVARAPRTVITQVALRPVDENATPVPLFSTQLPVNPAFTVVIGNKGQGKSALLDSIALAANSDRHDDFSFLSSERFRSNGGKTAALYEAELTWADGSKTLAGLNDGFETGAPILVDYLPQSLIEKVCSADPDSTEKRHFEAEIERVLFRHIPPEERGAVTTLSQHLHTQGHEERTQLESARGEIASIAWELMELTARRDELQGFGLQRRLTSLQARRQVLVDSISAIDSAIASGGDAQQQETAQAVTTAIVDRNAIQQKVQSNEEAQRGLIADIDSVESLMVDLREKLEEAHTLGSQVATTVGSAPEAILQTTLNDAPATTWTAARRADVSALQADLESDGGLLEQLRVTQRKVSDLESELSASGDEVHRLQQERTDLAAQLDGLDGDPSDAESIAGVSTLLAELEELPMRLAELNASLETGFLSVHQSLLSIMALQKAAYEPATDHIHNSALAKGVGLAFDVEFRVRGFVESWISMVNRQKLGDFYDVDQRDKDRAVLTGVSLEDPNELFACLAALVDRLGRERGSESGSERPLSAIMRSAYQANDLLTAIYDLRWLESQYIIRSDGSELSELSPGQRGLVLLLFYLLVDSSERPLLLDQPEENLDNQTVQSSLVPAIREATSRRQVIAVTHNPNLAVVGDADQIVVASVNRSFKYESGSLAELPVGLAAINVLEGTRGAFTTRELRYEQVVGH